MTAGVRGARDVDSVLGAYRLMVEDDLEAVAAEAVDDPWMRGAFGYHLGWADDAFRPLPPGERVVGGKRMRLRWRCSRTRPPPTRKVATPT